MRKALPVLFLLAGMSLSASPPVRKASPAKAEAPAQPATLFDLAWESIPASFHPDDFNTVYAANRAKAKGEFETAAQYQARLSLDTSKLYSFSVNRPQDRVAKQFKYDAEAQQFKIPCPIKSASPEYMTNVTYIKLREATRSAGPNTIGSNAFGANVIIEHRASDISGVTVHVSSSSASSTAAWLALDKECDSQGINVPLEEAKTAKESLEMLLVVRLSGEFEGQTTFAGSSYQGATIDAPVALKTSYKLISSDGAALVVYNRDTRKIYKKWILVKGNLSGDQGHKASTPAPPQRETKSFAEVCADLKNTDPVVFQQMGCK